MNIKRDSYKKLKNKIFFDTLGFWWSLLILFLISLIGFISKDWVTWTLSFICGSWFFISTLYFETRILNHKTILEIRELYKSAGFY